MKTLSILLLLSANACALDMNGLEVVPTSTSDAGPSPAKESSIDASPYYLTDAATSLYAIDQNAAQLACQKTCAGCCARDGLCHDGASVSLCGAKGFACVDCGGNYCNGEGFCTSEEPDR